MSRLILTLSLTPELYLYPVRLDKVLRDGLIKQKQIHLSRGELKAFFEQGKITLSGRMASAQTLLSAGEYLIEIEAGEDLESERGAQPSLHLNARVLYEDSEILVIDKPSGVPSVPHSASETETAVGLALKHCPKLRQWPKQTLEPGLLHRLDTETSGALVFAKTEAEYQRLRGAWKTAQTQKTYRALVDVFEPLPDHLPHIIRLPIGHDQKSSRRMRIATRDQLYRVRGKPLEAQTDLIDVQEVMILNQPHERPVADLTLQIHTGVMHQIRVHLSSLSWPILGDQTYHPSFRKNLLPTTRLWLHAWKLTLPLQSGSFLEITAPLPTDWPEQCMNNTRS